MARLIGEKDISGILAAAESWIQNCLVRDGAALSTNNVWTKEALIELHSAFIDNPLEDDRSYFEKLKVQIRDCSANAKCLMAELLWAARLFPSNIGAATKRRQVIEMYGLSGETLSPDHPMLSDQVLNGIGSAGPGYNNHFWREIAYIIQLGESIKGRDTPGRQKVFESYDEFVQWLAGIPQSAHRQFGHMLRYFAFPDLVERMSSSRERRNVIVGFRGRGSRELKRWSDRQLDEEVLAIRKEMEAKYPGQILDFYRPPLREQWIAEEEEEITSELSAWLLAWNPNRWAWEEFPNELARSLRGEQVIEKWSCSSRKVEVGDEVWLVRLGVEPRAVCGHGSVTREPFDAPHWDPERRAAGENARFIEVSFDSLRDPEGPDAVSVTELARHTGQERRWTPQQSGTQISEEDARVLRALWEGDEIVPMPRNDNTSLASVERNLTAEHVRQALAKIDAEGIPPHAKSTGYDLIDGSKRYPPKLVLEIAAEFSTGSRLDRSTFSGGESSKAVKILRDLGFDIESKAAIEDLIRKFLGQAKTTELATRNYPESYRGLSLKVSFGKGNVARIPWIALLAEGEVVSKGIYPVLLFFKQQNMLLLCYGISEENEPTRKWSLGSDFATVSEWFHRKYGEAPDRYGASFVKAAFTANDIDVPELTAQLDSMISEYRETVGEKALSPSAPSTVKQLESRADLPEAVRAFAAALDQANVSFGASHAELVQALLASLTTKPFAILTGLSGSGKTQIAIRLGEWLGREKLYVAAVRPDWTGAEAIFGYEDGLRPAVQGRAAWAVTGILDFILKADKDKQHPYLLVLDEMNLAHVERYFADVLSGMESRQECLPHITREADGCWRVASSRRIQLPKNLWIIGTVNVDETTYMFSPKVLDRANVFEFRVASADLRPGASKPHTCTPGDAALIRGLHAIANDDRYHKQAPAEVVDPIAAHLRRLHELLSRYGLEFGHRTFYEGLRFASLMSISGAKSPDRILDRIVVQKLLPRLHGSRRRLEVPLLALAQFARDLPEQLPGDDKLGAMQPDQVSDGSSPRLVSSYDKIVRMLRSLRANQFASFTE